MSILDDILAGTQPRTQMALVQTSPFQRIGERTARGVADEISPTQRRLLEDARRPRSVTGHVFDLLSRGEYASASLANSLLNEDAVPIGSALLEAFDEAITPERRLTYHDVIANKFPEFAKEKPVLTAIMSLAAGMALDPLNLLGFGPQGIRLVSKYTGDVFTIAKKSVKPLGAVFERVRGKSGWALKAPAAQFEDYKEAVFDLVRPSRTDDVPRLADDGGAARDIGLALQDKVRSTLAAALDSSASRKQLNRPSTIIGHEVPAAPRGPFNPDLFVPKVGGGFKKEPASGMLFEFEGRTPGPAQHPDFERWDVGTIGEQDLEKWIRHGARERPSFPRGALQNDIPLRPLNGNSIEDLALEAGERGVPIAVLVPPILRDGDRLSGAARLDDLWFVVGDQQPVMGGAAAMRALDKARGAYAGADEALAASRKLVDEGLERFQRSDDVRSVLDDLGLRADDLLDQGGIKVLGRTIASSKALKRVAESTGLLHAAAAVNALPTVQTIRKAGAQLLGTISRERRVQQILSRVGVGANGIAKTFRAFEGMRGRVETQFVDLLSKSNDVGEKFAALLKNADSEKRVQDALLIAQNMDARALEALRLEDEAAEAAGLVQQTPLGTAPFRDPRPPARKKLLESQEARHMQAAMDAAGLDPRERHALAELAAQRRALEETRAQAGLLGTILENYTPMRWQMTNPVRRLLQTRRGVVDPHLAAGEARETVSSLGVLPGEEATFALTEHARAKGWEPVYDAVALAGLQHLEQGKALIHAEHRAALRSLLPEGAAASLVAELEHDLFRVLRHEPGLPGGRTPEAIRQVIGLADKGLGAFKRMATIYNPAFWFKNVIGNSFQLAAKGVGAFDGTAWSAAWHAAMRGEMPKALHGAFGELLDADTLRAELARLPVLKNGTTRQAGQVELTGVRAVERSFSKARDAVDRGRALGHFGDPAQPSARGWAAILKRAVPYQDLAPRLEDTMRLASYWSYRGLGHAPEEAFKLMEKSLFNYTTALTKHEEQWLGRMVPFYRFQKFAAVLTFNALGARPGNLENVHKAARELGGAWSKIEAGVFGGDEKDAKPLTPSERHVLPGYMFEQPAAFAGIDPLLKEAVFRTMRGVNFLDWMNVAEFDEIGNFSAEKSLVVGGIGQLSPFIKAPIAALFETNFLNGETFGESRNIHDVDEERFWSTLGGLVGGATVGSLGGAGVGGVLGAVGGLSGVAGGLVGGTLKGAPGAVAGSLGGALLGRLGLNGVLRQITGWERAVDPRDGREKTYVSPMLLAVASEFFPTLNNALSLSRADRHPAEHIARTFFGINTVTLDLARERRYQIEDYKQNVDEHVARVRRLFRQGRDERAEDALENVRGAVRLLQDEATLSLGSPVRGRG